MSADNPKELIQRLLPLITPENFKQFKREMEELEHAICVEAMQEHMEESRG